MSDITIKKSELESLIFLADTLNEQLIYLDVEEMCQHEVKEIFTMARYYEMERDELKGTWIST